MSRPGPDWDDLIDRGGADLVATMRRYLEQIALSLTAASVRSYTTTLRQFATFLLDADPPVQHVADIGRDHIEAYKRHLTERPTGNGTVIAKNTRRQRLRTLRVFFERIIEWGYDDAPPRNPLFHGDIPTRDQALPRFLDDPTAAKFMRALAAEPDQLARLAIEILARTGMRVGELCTLKHDAVVQIGDAHWMRIPIGKLHNDRYVPLHPVVVQLLHDYQAGQPPTPAGLLLAYKGRRLQRHHVANMLDRIAARAEIPRLTPHQLRHTLATQAINRGMRLEAVAALLGHRSLEMTMTYARIADRTVAEEYHAVSEKVEALYNQPLPAETEGANMRRLRTDLHHRHLGNGHCTRPAELDCSYESICETCTFFSTNHTFATTLQQQRDHAADRDQHDRVDLFTLLLDRIHDEDVA